VTVVIAERTLMSHEFVLANIERAGDHAVVVGVMVAIAAAGGVAYGLARLVGRRHARSDKDARRPER
jgi:hypothetical protein